MELIVSGSIFFVGLAVALPSLHLARESARRHECAFQLRQLGMCLQMYHDTHQSFPYGCVGRADLPVDKRWSWQAFIGLNWGHYGIPKIDLDRAWDDPTLRPLMLRTWSNDLREEFEVPLWAYPLLECPNGTKSTHSDGQVFTDYVGVGGIGRDAPFLPRSHERSGMWAFEMQTSMDDCSDGTQTTLFVAETGSRNGCWLAGGEATLRAVDPDMSSFIGPGRTFGGLHSGGANCLFVDGHVEFVNARVDSQVLLDMATIGSETVPASSPSSRD